MPHDILNPGPHDALGKAREGEPVFLLLGRDAAAPRAIAEWCDVRRKAARELDDPKKRREELAQISEAEAIGMDMDEYRLGQESLLGRRATYADTVADNPQAGEIAKLIRAGKHLAEAAAHIQSGVELLAELGLLGRNAKPLDALRDQVNAIRQQYDMKEGQRSFSALPAPEEFA